MEWADAVRRLRRPRQCRDARRCPRRARVRRRGHRPVPHRAHVLRCRTDRRGARDDPRRGRDGPARGAGQDPADAAAGLHRAVRDHGRAAGDHPAARSAACTSSCRSDDEEIDEVARGRSAPIAERCARAWRSCTSSIRCSAIAACRLGDLLSRDRRDAGAGHFRGGGRGRRGGPERRRFPRSWCRWSRPGAELERSPSAIAAVRRGGRGGAGRHDRLLVGTMIELPRAALAAGDIAETRRVLLLRHQ